jgi:hypothetical protein
MGIKSGVPPVRLTSVNHRGADMIGADREVRDGAPEQTSCFHGDYWPEAADRARPLAAWGELGSICST